MRPLLVAAALLLAGPALAAPPGPTACAGPTRRLDLDEALAAAEAAIVALDADGLRAAVAQADYALACLAQPVDLAAAARWYRARGVYAFVTGDEPAATAAFRSARALEPAFRLDPALGPPLHAAWDAADPPEEAWTVPLPVPAEGWLQVDGRRSLTAPEGRGYVLQWFDASGAVRLTAAVPAGSWPPPFPVTNGPRPVGAGPVPFVPEPEPDVMVRTTKGLPERHSSRGLLVGGLAALAAGGAAMGASAAMQSAFLAGDATSQERPGLVAGNRAVGIGGIAASAVGVGLGVGAVVVGRW